MKVYACDAGCLDVPIELGQNRVRLPIKVTRPLTPILYISANKKHLEQLHGAIHVFEVILFLMKYKLIFIDKI